MTKLFQSRDIGLRRMVYLMIKELSPSADEVTFPSRFILFCFICFFDALKILFCFLYVPHLFKDRYLMGYLFSIKRLLL